jgi:hypothetical protein
MRNRAMCEKCKLLDVSIEHYQRLARIITDERTLAGIQGLVTELEAEKAALHPEHET